VLFAIALLLAVLAALGFVTMARTVETARLEGRLQLEAIAAPQTAHLLRVKDDALAGYLGALAFVALARLARRLDEQRRRALVRIAYPGRTVDVPRGWTVLEASRSHGIAHLSACGGRARCTTCRVRVVDGLEQCPPPTGDERRTLERIRPPPDVRLACQLRPTGDIAVEPVLAMQQARWLQPSNRLPKLVEREAALLGLAVRIGDAGRAASADDTFYAVEQHRALVEGLIEPTGGVPVEGGMCRWLGVYGLAAEGAAAARAALAAAEKLLDESDAGCGAPCGACRGDRGPARHAHRCLATRAAAGALGAGACAGRRLRAGRRRGGRACGDRSARSMTIRWPREARLGVFTAPHRARHSRAARAPKGSPCSATSLPVPCG